MPPESVDSQSLAQLITAPKQQSIPDEAQLIPAHIGVGYIKRISLGSSIELMIQQYEVVADVTLERLAAADQQDRIVFSFRNIFSQPPDRTDSPATTQRNALPSVQISSGNLELDFFFPPKPGSTIYCFR
ncbi:hypothetical protein GCM10028819_42090 [Spirosoma humi]